MVGGATYLSTQKMSEIEKVYDDIIHKDVLALKNNLQANVDVNVIAILAYRHMGADMNVERMPSNRKSSAARMISRSC